LSVPGFEYAGRYEEGEARRAARLVSDMPRPNNHHGEAESTCSPFEAVVVPIEGGRGLVPERIFGRGEPQSPTHGQADGASPPGPPG
jgi:hypothetical protein